MKSPTPIKSRYELRLECVEGVVAEHTALGAADRTALAAAILNSIDRTPEIVR